MMTDEPNPAVDKGILDVLNVGLGLGPGEKTDDEVLKMIGNIVSMLKTVKELDVKNFKIGSLPALVIKAMEIVEGLRNFTGAQKKALVVKSIQIIVDESDVAGMYEPFILPMVSQLIDELILVDGGKMKINVGGDGKMKTKIGDLFKCCMPKAK